MRFRFLAVFARLLLATPAAAAARWAQTHDGTADATPASAPTPAP